MSASRTILQNALAASTKLALPKKSPNIIQTRSNIVNITNRPLVSHGRTMASASSTAPSVKLSFDEYDPKQVDLMNEMCIVVDRKDNAIGAESKKSCHLMENINKGLLHRAFSVMIFNSKNQFLITQRSDEKITFPGYYTNTCCSHPLFTELEREEKDALGVRRAAQRRLELELGISPLDVSLTDLKFMTKFIYKAPSSGLWGEHEIDYALVVHKDVEISPDPNEVKSYRYLDKEELLPFLESEAKKGHQVTPWFRLMLDKFFFTWWDNLDNLDKFCEPNALHELS